MKYFNECKTLPEIKAEFKRLAFLVHPDKGGSNAEMQILNSEYTFVCAKCLKEGNYTAEQVETEFNFNAEYQAVINSIIGLENIEIVLSGLWIWVTGETKKHREALKQAGLNYASKKIAWYFRPTGLKSSNRKPLDLGSISQKYGASKITGKSYTALSY